jgi:hypothetical protein
MDLACRHGKDTAGTGSTPSGSAMVAGSGKDRYYVQDLSGKNLIGAQTNAVVELFGGNYIVEINGTKQRITVSDGQEATVSAGSATVAGSGKDRYYVQDLSGKNLIGAQTNAVVELFPGDYIVELNGATQRIPIRPGEQTIVRMK